MSETATPVTEIAFFHCQTGREAEFGPIITAAAEKYIAVSEGCRSIEVRQGVETPTTFVVQVEWDSLAAHQAFRDTDRLTAWRGEISGFFGEDPFVEHYRLI